MFDALATTGLRSAFVEVTSCWDRGPWAEMLESDEQLLAAVARCDRAAFVRLYDRFAPQVFGWLVKVVGRSSAEELLQETFLQVWNSATTYRPELATSRTWVFLIARSRAYDALRRSRRQPRLAELDEAACTASPDDPLLHDERRDRLNQALATLPEEQRRPIDLAFYGGQTYEAVASLLDLPLGTVKTRIRLGMTRLRTLLKDSASNP